LHIILGTYHVLWTIELGGGSYFLFSVTHFNIKYDRADTSSPKITVYQELLEYYNYYINKSGFLTFAVGNLKMYKCLLL